MTDSERRENVFTSKDRNLLAHIDAQCKEINGFVKRHEEEIFGSEDHKTSGLKPEVSDLKLLAIQVKTAIRVVVVLIGLVGITNIMILVRGG